MIGLVLNLGRYLLVGIILLFVYRVVRLINKDLAASQNQSLNKKGNILSKVKEVPKNLIELVILESDDFALQVGESIRLRNRITIGRGQENNIILHSATISKKHARFWEDNGHWWVEDFGSRNGTYVNDTKITKPVALTTGDKIRLGNFLFQFVRCDHEVQ